MSGKRMKQLRRAVKDVWGDRPVSKKIYKEAKKVMREKIRISNHTD